MHLVVMELHKKYGMFSPFATARYNLSYHLPFRFSFTFSVLIYLFGSHLPFQFSLVVLGPVIRLAPDAVHIADPQYYDQYFHFDRSEWWTCFNFKPGQKSLGWTLEMGEHNWRKKRIAPAVSSIFAWPL
jgi:hypothetical protein